MIQTDYSYIGVGQIYLRDRGGAGGLVPIGNVSQLDFAVQEEEKQLRDYRAAGGGMRNEVRRITGVQVTINMHDLSPDNLAMALYGSTAAVAEGAVSDEEVTVTKGALVPLAHAAPTDVVVTEDTEVDPATYVAGTDYVVHPGGLWFPADSTIAGATVLVAYNRPAQDVVQALNAAAGEYEMLFDGVNEARSGKTSVVRAHRVRFGAATSLPLIGDEYAGLELTGTLLSDDGQEAGLSRFFHATLVR